MVGTSKIIQNWSCGLCGIISDAGLEIINCHTLLHSTITTGDKDVSPCMIFNSLSQTRRWTERCLVWNRCSLSLDPILCIFVDGASLLIQRKYKTNKIGRTALILSLDTRSLQCRISDSLACLTPGFCCVIVTCLTEFQGVDIISSQSEVSLSPPCPTSCGKWYENKKNI